MQVESSKSVIVPEKSEVVTEGSCSKISVKNLSYDQRVNLKSFLIIKHSNVFLQSDRTISVVHQ